MFSRFKRARKVNPNMYSISDDTARAERIGISDRWGAYGLVNGRFEKLGEFSESEAILAAKRHKVK